MRTHMGSIYSGSPWGRLTAPLMKARCTKMICEMVDSERWPLFTSELRGPAAHLWSARGPRLTPSPVLPKEKKMIDDHQHANTAQYFNFLPRERGILEVEWSSEAQCGAPSAHNKHQPRAEDLQIQTENVWGTRSSLCQQNIPCWHHPARQ